MCQEPAHIGTSAYTSGQENSNIMFMCVSEKKERGERKRGKKERVKTEKEWEGR